MVASATTNITDRIAIATVDFLANNFLKLFPPPPPIAPLPASRSSCSLSQFVGERFDIFGVFSLDTETPIECPSLDANDESVVFMAESDCAGANSTDIHSKTPAPPRRRRATGEFGCGGGARSISTPWNSPLWDS